MIFDCVLALPTKTSVYGTLVGLLNTKAPEFGREACVLMSLLTGGKVVGRIYDELVVALKRNEFYNIKYLVRFLCELVNARVVLSKSVFSLLEKLLTDGRQSLGPLLIHLRSLHSSRS